jgi:hypothetical protein
MKELIIIIGASIAVSIGGVWAMDCAQENLVSFYHANLRSIFFSGFLTLSGFMLSMMAFVIIKIKEGIYDDAEYLNRIKKAKQEDSKITIYGPLKRLGILLFVTIASSVVCSILQVTAGFSSNLHIIMVVLASAWLSFALLIASLCVIIHVLSDYFKRIEETGCEKIMSEIGEPE